MSTAVTMEKVGISPHGPHVELNEIHTSALKETNIDLQTTANRTEHNTSQYFGKELILRRGQSFKITLTLNQALQRGESIGLTAETVTPPKSKIPLSSSAVKGSWSAVQEPGDSNILNFTIYSPPTANIGLYSLSARISSSGASSTIQLGQFTLLFNAWCADDEVFLSAAVERKEYVLRDSGIMYQGNENHMHELGWNFGQFEENILNLCLSMLDNSNSYRNSASADCAQRNNPGYVGRVVSAMVNSNDDKGVLRGNWSGDYSGGANPSSWNGSVAILQKWGNRGYKSVKFAQCWVFAGVNCTVLRCLGIPTRVISNFSSAHDTDGNLTIDEYYDKSGKALEKSDDSIWNFHVWNEGYFTRKDLGASYGGWQVLDATPQEQSTGLYQCGPTSVKAIKEGDVDLKYDGPFVFAEVNADCVSWIWHDNDEKEKLRDARSVGKSISTKALGSNKREDVTANYKYEEGSKKERVVFNKAYNKLFGRAPSSAGIREADVLEESLAAITGRAPSPGIREADVLEESLAVTTGRAPSPGIREADVPEESLEETTVKPAVSGVFKLAGTLLYGDDVNLILILKNSSTEHSKKITINISASSVLYTRRVMSEISKETMSVTLGPTKEKKLPFKITYAQYETYLSRGRHYVQINAICEVDGETKLLVKRSIFLRNPPINIEVLGPVVVNTPGKAEVTFANPLSEELKDGELQLVGATLIKGILSIKVDYVPPKESIKIPIEFSPTAVGKKQLMVSFSCNKFVNIKTFVEVQVVAV